MLVYESDGITTSGEPHSQYFTELAQRVIKTLSQMGPMGRLYSVDMRLRPTGKSGALVLPLGEFQRYFDSTACQLWERQSLARARVIRGETAFAEKVTGHVQRAVLGKEWCPGLAQELVAMRQRLEVGTTGRNLKRGPGGIVDVEFLVQLLQLKHGRAYPGVLRPNVWDALGALQAASLISAPDAGVLKSGYSFLRLVEARLRIVTDRPLTEVPDRQDEQTKLARRLGLDGPQAFLHELKRVQGEIRSRFEAITDRERIG
jgi:glutamate-ammonia-ligase adenylyltransferase